MKAPDLFLHAYISNHVHIPILLHHSVYMTRDNIYYIPINATLFPAGKVCCLGHVSARVCHIQVPFLVTIILPYT
jgi:hypothetical protein